MLRNIDCVGMATRCPPSSPWWWWWCLLCSVRVDALDIAVFVRCMPIPAESDICESEAAALGARPRPSCVASPPKSRLLWLLIPRERIEFAGEVGIRPKPPEVSVMEAESPREEPMREPESVGEVSVRRRISTETCLQLQANRSVTYPCDATSRWNRDARACASCHESAPAGS